MKLLIILSLIATTGYSQINQKDLYLVGEDLKDAGKLHFTGIGIGIVGFSIIGINQFNGNSIQIKAIGYSVVGAGIIINVGSFYEVLRAGKRLSKKKC